jgi:putative ABC transport system permease protein
LDGRDFTVSGIYHAEGTDKIFAYTDYGTAKDFTRIGGPPVFHVLMKDTMDVDALAAKLPFGPAYRKWPTLATYYVQVNTMFMGFIAVIRAIILLVTLFILGNTMNRIVFERMREWGTLRALGTKRRDTLILVVLEGSLLGLVGAAIGVALGFGLSALINLGGGLPFNEGTRILTVELAPNASAVTQNILPVIATAAIAAFFPARRAVLMTPSECLRQL